MIYIVCFSASAFFLWLGTKGCTTQRMKSNEWTEVKLKKIPTIIGILIPVLLASFRDTCIGSDVEFYVVPYFRQAVRSSDFVRYAAMIGGRNTDMGYNLLNFIISRFTDNIGWLFFFTELLTISFVFAGCWMLRAKAQPWLSMLFYYFIFYNMTLSTVRQCCACAISFFAIANILHYEFQKNKVIESLFFWGVAMTFHRTSVFAIILVLIFWIICRLRINPVVFGVLSVVACIILRFGAEYFSQIVLKLTMIVNMKYSTGLYRSSVGANGYTSVIMVAVLVCAIQFIVLKNEVSGYWKNINKAFLALNMLYIGGMLFLSTFTFMPRMLYYIQMLWNISLSQSWRIVKNTWENRTIMIALTLFILITYWVYFYIIGGVHETYPYILR